MPSGTGTGSGSGSGTGTGAGIASEPVTRTEAKAHLRVDFSDDDDLIDNLITAAREYCEAFTNRRFITETKTYKLDVFPAGDLIELPCAPVQSPITSIAYVDVNGTTQTFSSASYSLRNDRAKGEVVLGYGYSWPTTRDQPAAVTITYVAGYGDLTTDVPEAIRAAIKLLVADMYEHREAQVETRMQENPTVQRLLWPYRVWDTP